MTGFGERLKKLRREHDVTQTTLAEYIGVVPSAVGKYERLPNAYPSVEALVKIADFFQVSLDYLLRGTESIPSMKNNFNGPLSNSPFIQANHGEVIYNSDNSATFSPEALELQRIYDSLNGRERLKLLNFAVKLEEGDSV